MRLCHHPVRWQPASTYVAGRRSATYGLIFPTASEPANGRARRDSQEILVFPFRTTPRRSRRAAAGVVAPARPPPPREGWLFSQRTMASALTCALTGRGLPAGAWSKAAESVYGTSNDTVGGTFSGIANGIRSHRTYAGGGDHGLLRLTEDHAVSAGTAPLEAQDDASSRPAAGDNRLCPYQRSAGAAPAPRVRRRGGRAPRGVRRRGSGGGAGCW